MPKQKTIFDNRIALDVAVRDAGPELYWALRDLLQAITERRGFPGIDSIETATIAKAQALVDRLHVPQPKG